MEDGFAAYASSKAALNMAIRHMAAELKRKDDVSFVEHLAYSELSLTRNFRTLS